jgi:preprotein translocase subunit SecB
MIQINTANVTDYEDEKTFQNTNKPQLLAKLVDINVEMDIDINKNEINEKNGIVDYDSDGEKKTEKKEKILDTMDLDIKIDEKIELLDKLEVRTYICIYMCICIYKYIYACLNSFTCSYICIYVYIYICIYVYIYIYKYRYLRLKNNYKINIIYTNYFGDYKIL